MNDRRRDESAPLAPPRPLTGGSKPQDRGRQADAQAGRPDSQGSGSQQRSSDSTPPPPHTPLKVPGSIRTTGQPSSREDAAKSDPAESSSAQRDQERDDRDQQTSDDENTSPVAMAAAAMTAAKDRLMRGGERDDDTQIHESPFGASAMRRQERREEPRREEYRASPPPPPPSRPVQQSRSETQRPTPAPRPMTRRARLRLVRVDPWSVMKTAFLLSIAFGIMCVVAVFVIWSVLSAANVFGSINSSVEQVIETEFAIEDYVGMDRVLPFTILIAVVDVVLLTAIATLGAFLYNLAASLLGGLEVTLAEDNR